MGMVVRSNIMALNANRQLGMNSSQVSRSLEKLSSGFKINRAGDDASGLAISEKMKAQIKSLETASANCQDGISLVQTAEGNLTEVHDMLNRMVELAEKSANGTMEMARDENGEIIDGSYGNGGTDRNAIQVEIDQLATEIDRIAKSANFNGIKLLDGSLSATYAVKGSGAGNQSGLPQAVDFQGTANIKGELVAPSKSTAEFTVNTKGATGESIKIQYRDSNGQIRTLDFTGTALSQTDQSAWAASLVKEMGESTNNNVKEFLKLFDIKSVGTKITFTSKESGNNVPAVVAVSSNKAYVFDASAGANIFVKASNAAEGHDRAFKINIGANPMAGESIKIGDKTFQFITNAGDAVSSGNIGIVIGGTAADTASNIVKALCDNGIEASNVDTNGTATANIIIKDIDKISSNQSGAFGIDSTSNGVNVTNTLSKGAEYTIGTKKDPTTKQHEDTTLRQGDIAKIEVRYTDANGELKTISLDHVVGNLTAGGAADAKKKVTALQEEIAKELENNKEFRELFEISTVLESGKPEGFSIKTKNVDDAHKIELIGISVKDKNDVEQFGATATATAATDPGKVMTLTSDNIKSGDTVTIDGKVYEFTDKPTTELTDPNHIRVNMGSDINETATNLKNAMESNSLYDGEDFIFKAGNLGATPPEMPSFTFKDNDMTLKENGSNGNGLTLQIGDTYESFNLLNVSIDHMDMANLFKGTEANLIDLEPDDAGDIVKSLDVSSQEQAGHTLNAVKLAINKVSTQRAKLGAAQNRLEHTINNLDVTAENMNSANSRVRDTDMAKQMMDYTKMNVLTQAAQAMLAQANQQPQSVLQLLQ